MARKLLQQQLKELGSKLENPPASKDALIKLLKQGATCLSELEQSPPKSIMESMLPFQNAIAKREFLKHQNREVKLLLAACHCEITRITAPEAPYDDDVFKDVFELIVSTFSGLSDTKSPSFGRRVVILETLARYRSCVVMLDLECDDLINEMFNIFFEVVRDEHSENVLLSMQTIMECLIEESEDVDENLLLILLSVLGHKEEDVTKAARRLAMNVIERCSKKLEPAIKQFLVSAMSGERQSLKPKINHHHIIYDIYRCAPQILSGVVPYLTEELLSDQLDNRLKAVSLVGELFALPGSTISEAFQPVFVEILKRLTDRVPEVRMFVLQHVRSCLLSNPSRAEAPQIIAALHDRLLDYDENVRKQVVSVICDVACHTLIAMPVETIKLVSERLRDKSLLVKEYTMGRLAEIHRASCLKPSGWSTKNGEYNWIVRKILKCFYDKDFRSDMIESILSLSLFPTDLSVKDKVVYWVRIFSGFDKIEVKALEKILEQKHRLQQEMQKYLSFRQSTQEGDGAEIQKKVMFHFRVMSHCFPDPAKAEENFIALDQIKDSNIWKIMERLLDPNTSFLEANSSRDDLMKILGSKHPIYEFMRALSLKCSYLLFDKNHVREILVEAGVQKSSGNNELILSCMTSLVILARFCPLLFVGIEEDLVHLLEDDNEIMKEGTLHILAKAGGTIREQLGVSSRSLDLILERICIEGSRRQAKFAVHALVSITKDDGLMSLSVLYKRLIDMLEEKSHLPAVLQSLGCIAQAAMPVYETRESEVEKFIKQAMLQLQITGDETTDCWDDRSELCSLKIFGVKALVKSYLPVKDVHLRSGIDNLIELLKNILTFGEISKDIESRSVDRAHLKLAAAKAVLRLSKHWELKIPTDVFYLTLRTSEHKFPEVRKLLLNKIHQYIKDRTLDPKYACAFLLDISFQQSDLEENKCSLNDIIQICRQGRARQISSQIDANSLPVYAAYILPYVVHSLAHHPSFPNIDECKDVTAFEAIYRQLYLFLSMLVHGDAGGKSDITISNMETISLSNSIFRCIKHSEDAFDVATSKNLYALCDLGMSIIKRLVPKQDDLQNFGTSVILPHVFYKPLEKRDENDSQVAEEKTWLANEGVLAHFQSLELETNGIINSIILEDDIMKDSETEGAEMPLGKLMKLLKARAAKARKEVKNESTPTGVANENDLDNLKRVKKINSDNLDTASKFESSNGHKPIQKKRKSDQKLQKRESLFSGSKGASLPKRRRTSSTQGHKSSPAVMPKYSKMPTNVYEESDKMDLELPSSSENQSMQENTAEPAESNLLVSRGMRNSIFSSKQKGKRLERDYGGSLSHSPIAKRLIKVSGKDGSRSASYSRPGSMNKQPLRSVSGLQRCTTKDDKSVIGDLIGCRIKVWWPDDKKFYKGVVKSFDTQKKKHVVLYDDGDVEVLRLDKERWELLDDSQKSQKQSGSSKLPRSKTGSSGGKRKSIGERSLEEKLSQVRGKRTPRRSNQKPQRAVKSKSFTESGRSPDVTPLEFTPAHIDSEAEEENERIEKPSEKELNDAEKPGEAVMELNEVEKSGDAVMELNEAEKPEDTVMELNEAEKPEQDKDSKETHSNEVGVSTHDVDKSNNTEKISYVDEKLTKEESDKDIPDNKDSASGDEVLPDDEPLGAWQQRAGRK